nr:hypothetical protein [Shimazuella alba]
MDADRFCARGFCDAPPDVSWAKRNGAEQDSRRSGVPQQQAAF